MNNHYEERIAKLEKEVAFLSDRLTLEKESRRRGTRLEARHRNWTQDMILRLFKQVDPGYLTTMEQLRSIIGKDKDDDTSG